MSSREERLRDEILILEYRSGDKRALERLVSRWQPRVYRYVLAMLQEENAAWDVSQDVWLAAVTGLDKVKPIQNFPAWLCRVAPENLTYSLGVSVLVTPRLGGV